MERKNQETTRGGRVMYNQETEASFRSSFLLNTEELQSELQDFVEEMDSWSHKTETKQEEKKYVN